MSVRKVRLGELVEIRGGGTPSKEVAEYWNGFIPWASVKDFKATEIAETIDTITEEGVANSATNIIPAGNVLVPTRMAVGKAAMNKVAMAINQDLKGLIPKPIIDARFLLHALLANNKTLENQATGATVKGITLDVLRALEIPLPSLDEQKRLAAILDKADELRAKRRKAIALLDSLTQSIFLEMFGDPAVNPLGLPKEPLGALIKVASGNGLTAAQMDVGGIYNVYGGNGINGRHSEYMFEDPQITIGRVGVYCGAVHLTVPNSWITDNALYVSKRSPNLSLGYLAEALRLADLNQYAGRAAQPLISGSRIYPVKILVPPIDEQIRFERSLLSLEATRLTLEKSKEHLEAGFYSLQHRAFAGQL